MRSSLVAATLALLALCSVSLASTVTLTGLCTGTVVNATHSYTTFYLANSGNGTATQLILLPKLSGAVPAVPALNASSIGPGGNVSFDVSMHGLDTPGSYAENFLLEYTQGSDTYVALFPCIVSIGRSVTSLVAVTTVAKVGGDGWNASALALAPYPVNATVHVAVPPELTGPPDTTMILEPDAQTPIPFNVTTRQTATASFASALEISYVHNGTHYATMKQFVVSIAGNAGGGQSALLLAIGAVVLALVAMIAISAAKKRRGGPNTRDAASTGGVAAG